MNFWVYLLKHKHWKIRSTIYSNVIATYRFSYIYALPHAHSWIANWKII